MIKNKKRIPVCALLLIFAFLSVIASECHARISKKNICTIATGRKKEELSNYTMEGGMPFSPVSMASNGRIFFFAEPHRFRISAFNDRGNFLFEVSDESFKDIIKLIFTKDNRLIAVFSNGETSMDAWIYTIDSNNISTPLKKPRARIVPRLTNPGVTVYSIEYISSCSVIAVQTESEVLLYNSEGKYLRSAISPFLSADGSSLVLDLSDKLSLLVYNAKNELVNTWIPSYFAEFSEDISNPILLRQNNIFYITWYSTEKRSYQYYQFFQDLSGGRLIDSQDMPVDFTGRYLMHIPYPPGDIQINELINE